MGTDGGFSAFRDRLGPLRAEWTDRVVPNEVELLPDSRYAPVYAWMYSYEKGLKRRVESALGRPLGAREKDLFGSDGVVSEGLSNAFVHGQRRDPKAPIVVRTAVSRRGLAFSIRDRGPGFECRSALRQAARQGSEFYHFAGNGLRALLACRDLSFSYTDGGRCLNLLLGLRQTAVASQIRTERDWEGRPAQRE